MGANRMRAFMKSTALLSMLTGLCLTTTIVCEPPDTINALIVTDGSFDDDDDDDDDDDCCDDWFVDFDFEFWD
jgi:hypothetical protein